MTVYMIATVQTDDPEGYKVYSAAARPTIIKAGGWYVGRANVAGDAEIIEGDCEPGRYIIIAFENREAVLRWYNSPEYQEAIKIREPISKVCIFIVDEVPPEPGVPTRPWGELRM
jgi:uncharacterized protein (DUF1330 family)